jgi:hypothetical protein
MADPVDCRKSSGNSDAEHRRNREKLHYDDDMDDTDDLKTLKDWVAGDEPHLEPLYTVMQVVQDAVHEPYAKFDAKAVAMHWYYKYDSVAAVVSGAASVFFAIAEATKLWDGKIDTLLGELLTVFGALFFISIGIAVGFKQKWILARTQAERLRLLKFRALTNPNLWCEGERHNKAVTELQYEVDCISTMEYPDAKSWAKEGVHPSVVTPPCKGRCELAMDEFLYRYIPKRLQVQMEYLKSHWDRVEFRGIFTATLVTFLYWGSFIFVFCHMLNAKFIEKRYNIDPKYGVILAFSALAVPIFAAGLRTYRAAHEFERNALRHKATYDSLRWLLEQFDLTDDLEKKFEIVGFTELILEADCREFIRLTSEAEWYG